VLPRISVTGPNSGETTTSASWMWRSYCSGHTYGTSTMRKTALTADESGEQGSARAAGECLTGVGEARSVRERYWAREGEHCLDGQRWAACDAAAIGPASRDDVVDHAEAP
jgi:hypothetical protein